MMAQDPEPIMLIQLENNGFPSSIHPANCWCNGFTEDAAIETALPD